MNINRRAFRRCLARYWQRPKVGACLDVQNTVTKMRRLARAYQARLNFYLINRGELRDYEGMATGRGENGRGVVIGAVSALRAKQPYDFVFDPHSELTVEKLKDWIDQFLSGKLKKVGTSMLARLYCCIRRSMLTNALRPAWCRSTGAAVARRVAELSHVAN